MTNKVKEQKPAFTLAEGATHIAIPSIEHRRSFIDVISAKVCSKVPTPAEEGFTLAEVLITLGIIGVVAAMTIPTLMTNYTKHKTETQLVKFYSMMNQTLRMSVSENGDPDGWIIPNKSYTSDESIEILKTYILPYMKNLGYEKCTLKNAENRIYNNVPCIYLMDGGVITFNIDTNGGDMTYWLDKKYLINNPNYTRHAFGFQLVKSSGLDNGKTNSRNYIEPYSYLWDGTREGLKNHQRYGCRKDSPTYGFCTKYIQMNSWKIPPDYPW